MSGTNGGAYKERYETEHDLEMEREICKEICLTEWGCGFQPIKLTRESGNEGRYHADYYVQKAGNEYHGTGYGHCWLEIKDREDFVPKGYDSVLLDLYKWRAMCSLAQYSGLPAYFCPRLSGVVHRLACEPGLRFKMKWMGRIDRSDPADKHPVLLLPLEAFEEVV